jgi:oligoendopeptidase F
MSILKWIYGFCLICLFISLNSCQTEQVTEAEAKEFINNFESRAEFLNRQISIYTWNSELGKDSDSLSYFLTAWNDFISDKALSENLKKYSNILTDKNDLRKMELISNVVTQKAINSDKTTSILADSLEQDFGNISYTFEGRIVTLGFLHSILRTESNRFRREEAFQAIYQAGANLSGSIARLVRYRNQVVEKLGYNSYYDLLLTVKDIDKIESQNIIEDLDRITAVPYFELIDSLKNSLSLEKLSEWDIEYAYRNILSVRDSYFPASSHLSLIRKTLSGLGFNLDGLPIYLKRFPNENSDSKFRLLPVTIPDDIRILYAENDGFEQLTKLFSNLSHGIYTSNIYQTDYLYSHAPSDCFESAIGSLFSGYLCKDGWLRKYPGLPEPIVMEMNSYLKFIKLYSIRRMILEAKFEKAIYQNPYADLNRIYENLSDELLNVQIHAHISPWAVNQRLVSDPVSIPEMIIGECIAAQIGFYLKEKYGTELDNVHTREYLVQNIFRFGARDNWQVLLERSTDSKLDVKFFADYHSI